MMSHRSNIKQLLSSRQNPLPLYAGSFFFSGAHGGILTLTLPFIILLVGGTDRDLGLCSGLGSIAYLIACLVTAKHLDKVSPKRALQLSTTLITVAVMGIVAVTWLSVHNRCPISPVVIITMINILLSLLLSLFWPPMMGWISTGYEGPPLSKRLGVFNLSWSVAIVISPLIAGFIIDIDPNLAMLMAAVFFAMALLCVSIAPSPAITPIPKKQKETTPAENVHRDNAVFCLMARFALVTTCIVIALMRTQLALFFTENLGFTKTRFGILTTLWSFSNLAVFFITSKTHRWHHKLTPFILAQIITAMGMMIILFFSPFWSLCLAAIFIGAGPSFIYSSHQYYGVSGQRKRSGTMAIHEILISIGYGSGAIIGGYLAEYFGRQIPYGFGAGVVLVALVIQMIFLVAYKKQHRDKSLT